MKYRTISFAGFDGRKEDLEAIKRFNSLQPMYYRTNDYSHSQRVLWLVEELLPYAVTVFPHLDAEMARTLAPVHDDSEIITGDIELDKKMRMSPEELQQLELKEAAAIEILAARFPKTINGFNYRDLLYHALHKDCVEAQLVSYADKKDACGEGRHEIDAGNDLFIASERHYEKIFQSRERRWPLLTDLFNIIHPLLLETVDEDLEAIAKKGKYHTLESIYQPSGNTAYDYWKKVTLERDGIKSLITVKEHKIPL